MAATAPRKLAVTSDAAREVLGFGSGPGDEVPWDLVFAKLGELLRFLLSALQALVGELQEAAAGLAQWAQGAAFPAAVTIGVLLFLCCCGFCGRRRRGPDGEEVVTAERGGDGPVVRYRRGGGGVFSMHPNKPIV